MGEAGETLAASVILSVIEAANAENGSEQPKTDETIDRRQTAGPKHVSETIGAFLRVSKSAGSDSLPPSQTLLALRASFV
jgi:hypothetical protein